MLNIQQQSNQTQHQLSSNQMQKPQIFTGQLDQNKPTVSNLPHYQNSMSNDRLLDHDQQFYPPGHPLHLNQQQKHQQQMPTNTQQFVPQQLGLQAPLNQPQVTLPNPVSLNQPINQQQPQLPINQLQIDQSHRLNSLPPSSLSHQQQQFTSTHLQTANDFYPPIGHQTDTLAHQQSSFVPTHDLSHPMNQAAQFNQAQTSIIQTNQPFSSRPHTSHFSPQFQRKMPQIRPEMLRSKSKERELPFTHGRSPFDSPTSVSSSGSLTDQCYTNKNKYLPEYSSRHRRSIDDTDYHINQNKLDYHHRSPKHIKYADELSDPTTTTHHTSSCLHRSTNLGIGQQQQSYLNATTRSDRNLDRHFMDRPISDRHLSCESPTAGLTSSKHHHSKRSLQQQSSGYHSLHTSPRKTPSSTTQVCGSEICHHSIGNQTVYDECSCNQNLKSTICSHHRHHTPPKHPSPSKHSHLHHSQYHSHNVNEHNLCTTATCTTCAVATSAPNLKDSHLSSYDVFHQQQKELLKQQEKLVDGMKKIQKKKIRKLHEVWSPTTSSSSNQLSPVDIGPLLDSIVAPLEKEAKKQEKEQLKQLIELRRLQQTKQDEYEYESNIPRVKSGTITGMLDDFNKQMEQLKIREKNRASQLNDLDDKPLRSREEIKSKEEKGRRYSLDSKVVNDISPPRKLENKKLPTVSETDRITSELERNRTAIARLSNALNSARNAQSHSTYTDPIKTLANSSLTEPSKSTLNVQPIKKTLEKIVSPVIDKTMKQTQLLITQQQQLILLQKEQNKLQQQLQGLFSSFYLLWTFFLIFFFKL